MYPGVSRSILMNGILDPQKSSILIEDPPKFQKRSIFPKSMKNDVFSSKND